MKNFKKITISRAEKTSWAMVNAMRAEEMVAMSSLASAKNIESVRELYVNKGLKPPSYTAIIIKASELVLKKHPEANRAILGFPFFKKLYQFDNFDISVAVEKSLPGLPGQPYAATIKDVNLKSLAEIDRELKQLATCTEADDKKFREFMFILKHVPQPISNLLINMAYLSPKLWSKYRGCAAWVNSPAKAGADLVVTCWPWPLTLSFGRVKQRPLVVENSVEPCMTIPLLISFDRRIMGGGPASRIFASFVEIVENAPLEFLP